MTKNFPFVKLTLILFVSTVVMFSFSYMGSKLTNGGQKLDGQTTDRHVKVAAPLKKISQPAAKEVTVDKVSLKMGVIPEKMQVVLLSNKTIEIPAESNISLIEILKKQKLENISPETLSTLATAIYQAILPTNFTILERNTSSKLPDYADLGFEAKLDPKQNMDLVFSNPNKTKYVLNLQIKNNSLHVSLKGRKLSYEYKMTTNDIQYYQPKTVVQYSPLLSQGQVQLANAGSDGQAIKVYRNIYRGAFFVKRELVSNDYYPPEYRVEVHPVATIDIQQGTSMGNTARTDQPASTLGKSQPSDQSQNSSDGSTKEAQGSPSNSKNKAAAPADSKVKSANNRDLWGKTNEAAK